jgi:ribosomal protein S18 acetylase RimI-like enzyme
MSLTFRLAGPEDLPALEVLITEAFGPITWLRKFDERYGAPKGCDWKQRWKLRLEKVWQTQIVLVGEQEGTLVAAATGTYEEASGLGYIDLLAVDQRHQGKGYGRQMLNGMMAHFRALGGVGVHLECLQDNAVGNALYAREGFEIVASSVRWYKPLA